MAKKNKEPVEPAVLKMIQAGSMIRVSLRSGKMLAGEVMAINAEYLILEDIDENMNIIPMTGIEIYTEGLISPKLARETGTEQKENTEQEKEREAE